MLRRALAVERVAADHFNFRSLDDGVQYKERWQAFRANFGDELRSFVRAQATELRLVTPTTPRYDADDRTLVLGGGFRSPLLRARYASLLQRQRVDLGAPYFLGSPRPLITTAPAERPVVESYAPGAADEFDLMTAAAGGEFGLAPADVRFLCGCASDIASCPRWKARTSAGAE
ncbi:MAG: hypothetical protein ABI140_05935 [Jatrophihabitantaceae bacterium]